MNTLGSDFLRDLSIAITTDSFSEVHDDILEIFASFVAEALLSSNNPPDSSDVDALVHRIGRFTCPSGRGPTDIGVIICHWPPLKRAEKEKRVSSSKKRKRDSIETELPQFCRTYDTEYLSMKVLGRLFPDIEDMRVVDIYTKRVPITDEDGERLPGTTPYDDDPALSLHHGHAKLQTEKAPGNWVLVCGLPCRDWFEACFGKLGRNGSKIKIGDRERRVFYIDHMEFLARWANVERLENLRKTLHLMERLRGVRINEDWINKRIGGIKKQRDPNLSGTEQHKDLQPVTSSEVNASSRKLLKSRREGQLRRWSGEAGTKRRAEWSAFFKQLWDSSSPTGALLRKKQSDTGFKRFWGDDWENMRKLSKTARKKISFTQMGDPEAFGNGLAERKRHSDSVKKSYSGAKGLARRLKISEFNRERWDGPNGLAERAKTGERSREFYASEEGQVVKQQLSVDGKIWWASPEGQTLLKQQAASRKAHLEGPDGAQMHENLSRPQRERWASVDGDKKRQKHSQAMKKTLATESGKASIVQRASTNVKSCRDRWFSNDSTVIEAVGRLSPGDLEEGMPQAIYLLQLDPTSFDYPPYSLPPSSKCGYTPAQQSEILEIFHDFARTQSGFGPFLAVAEYQAVATKIGRQLTNVREKFLDLREVCRWSQLVVAHMGVKVDYTTHPHLKWLSKWSVPDGTGIQQ